VVSALDSSLPAPRWRSRWPWALLFLALASALWPMLGLPAAFLCFLGVLSLPAKTQAGSRRARWCVAIASLAASFGVLRFVVFEAMPGIVQGGRGAVEERAVSRLRDILFAEDAMRSSGWIDPDADGIGSAALLSELCGGPPLRGQIPRPTPVLDCDELVPTALGPAWKSGPYLYTVCLPRRTGTWSAQPGLDVDEEQAERRFVAYAWPEAGSAFGRAFFIDEHENILSAALSPDSASDRPGQVARLGLSCVSAIDAPPGAPWSPWRGKKPRTTLAGDTTAAPARP
jgi:hypothetical protein